MLYFFPLYSWLLVIAHRSGTEFAASVFSTYNKGRTRVIQGDVYTARRSIGNGWLVWGEQFVGQGLSREPCGFFSFLHFGFVFLLYYGVAERGAHLFDAGTTSSRDHTPRGLPPCLVSFYHEAGPCQWACHNLM